jgi:serine/threonine-protein kinase
MSAPYDMKAGNLVAGRYRLERPLGQGGMGEVWAAVHLITGKQVALKALKAEKAARPELVHRFFREARAATVVGHANVVEVHDVFSFDGAPVMVMELLEGESLGEKLRRERQLSLAELATLLVPVISAVGTAHARGIVHRDLKPENIFLARDGAERCTPKVLDFGIAKLAQEDLSAEAAELTRTGSMVGTPFYMAPEQAAGERDLDHRCDVWALGVICFEALLGRRPFEGDNFGQIFKRIITEQPASLRQLRPDLPLDVADLIDGMLVKERSGRRGLAEVQRVIAPHGASTAPEFGLPSSQSASRAAGPAHVEPFEDVGAATLPETTLASAGAPAAEALLGTLDATTRGPLPASSSRLSALQTRLGLGAVAVGLMAIAGALVWSAPRGSPATAAANATIATTGAVGPSTAGPALSVEPRRAEPAPVSAPTPSAAASPRSSVRRPSAAPASSTPKTPAAAPASVDPPAPKRLPGGILDQERAPF